MQNKASKTEPGRQLRGTLVPREYLWPFILLTSLFAFWGVANNMDGCATGHLQEDHEHV